MQLNAHYKFHMIQDYEFILVSEFHKVFVQLTHLNSAPSKYVGSALN